MGEKAMSWEDDDWDADDIEPVEPEPAKKEAAKSQWDDDDDEEEENPKHVVPESKAAKEKKGPQIAKATVKSKKDLVKKKEAASNLSEGQRAENKQQLVEDGDFALTEELFGVEASGSATNPVNKEEHEALGTIMGKKGAAQVGSYHFGAMMKALLTTTLAEAKADQIKELTTHLNVMFAERQKAEKAALGGKKKTAAQKKKTLARDHTDEIDDYDVGLTTTNNYAHAGFDD